MMRRRALGRTGLEISEIGLGAWPIGGASYGDVAEEQAAAVLEAYFEEGGNFIDTARSYGESERRIGESLRRHGNRDSLIIATKSPHTQSPDDLVCIREDLETSLRLMGIDHVDLYYLHSPPEDRDLMRKVLDEFERLKEKGLIRYIGASIKGPNVTQDTVDLCRQYVDSGRVDAIQLIFSVFRQRNREAIRYALDHGVGIVARTALESGFLTGKYDPELPRIDGNHRARWSGHKLQAMLKEALELQEWAIQPPYHSLAQVALAYVLAEEGVSTIIVGAKNRYQVVGNTEVGELPLIDRDTYARLSAAYAQFTDRANTGAE